MRLILATVFVVVSAGLGLADEQTAPAATVALQSASQPSQPAQTPAEASASEQSYFGFSGNCSHRAKNEDTAKLLMN